MSCTLGCERQSLRAVIQPTAVIRASLVVGQGPAGPQGPPGTAGPGGGVDLNLAHVQSAPSASWSIAHGLGKRPSVSVFVGGVLVEGDPQHVDANNLVINFSAPVSGVAYLN